MVSDRDPTCGSSISTPVAAPRVARVGIEAHRPIVAAAAIAVAVTLCLDGVRPTSCAADVLTASEWAAAPIAPAVGEPATVTIALPAPMISPEPHSHGARSPLEVTYQRVRRVALMRWGGRVGP